MFSVRLEWKPFNINIGHIEEQVRSLCKNGEFVGSSADSALTLWFNCELAPEDVAALQAGWDALDENSEEALSYVSAADLMKRMEEMKEAMIEKSWDEMSLVERKLMLGRAVTRNELGF